MERDKKKEVSGVRGAWESLKNIPFAGERKGSEAARNMETLGYGKEMPSFLEQVGDVERTDTIKYLPSSKAEWGRDNEDVGPESVSEHDALGRLREFLVSEGEDESIGANLRNGAKALAESLNFIGEKELDEGARGIAEYWKGYLDKNKKNQLVVQLMSDIGGFDMVKSDMFLLDRVLGNFSEKEVKRYKGRLFRRTDDDRIDLSGDGPKVVVLDDWSISGEQMREAEYGVFVGGHNNGRTVNPEINLLIGKKEQTENGYTYAGNNVVPLRAYWLAREDERFAVGGEGTETSRMGNCRITGFYSSVDYGFEQEIGKMVSESDKGLVMPPLTNIVRPYRQEGYEARNVERVFGGDKR